MGPCHGYSCLARSLEEQDEQDARAEREGAQSSVGGGVLPAVPVLSAMTAPALGLFAGTPLDIIQAALTPWRSRSTT